MNLDELQALIDRLRNERQDSALAELAYEARKIADALPAIREELLALRGKALAYDLDRAGIEWRNKEAVELVELRAELLALRREPVSNGYKLPRRFQMYRRNVPTDTHDENQRNAPEEVQFEGVVFSDGKVAVRWLTAKRSVSVWDCLDDMLAIHGHPEYGSELVWIDAAPQAYERGEHG